MLGSVWSPAQLAPPLDITASRPILDESGRPLKGSNPNAETFGFRYVPGCLVHVIHAGSNRSADPPGRQGEPGGDDHLLHETAVGVGVAPSRETSGMFSVSVNPPPELGARIYVRVFNGVSLDAATRWGESSVYTVVPLRVMDVSALGLDRTTRRKSGSNEARDQTEAPRIGFGLHEGAEATVNDPAPYIGE